MNAVDEINTRENTEDSAEKRTLGNTANVAFITLGNRGISGKVDTGATTSSLHAENIKINSNGGSVSFSCPDLSNQVITMDMDGSQEVVSADAGGNQRPIVKFDVEIDGVPIQGASFNLNDRSEMDSPILIGQNILKAGNFVIDVSKEESSQDAPDQPDEDQRSSYSDRDVKVLEAIQTLTDNNVDLREFMLYLRTIAVNDGKSA